MDEINEPELTMVVTELDARESRHDPLMTAFIGMIIGLLLLGAIIILIANSRPPAGL